MTFVSFARFLLSLSRHSSHYIFQVLPYQQLRAIKRAVWKYTIMCMSILKIISWKLGVIQVYVYLRENIMQIVQHSWQFPSFLVIRVQTFIILPPITPFSKYTSFFLTISNGGFLYTSFFLNVEAPIYTQERKESPGSKNWQTNAT